jgi:hypothetical protein
LSLGYQNNFEQRGDGDSFNIIHTLVCNFNFHNLLQKRQ